MGKGRVGKSKRLASLNSGASLKKKPLTEKSKDDQRKEKLRDLRNSGKHRRNARGQITKAAEFASSKVDQPVVRVQPDRRWFGNTRVIGQTQLDRFRDEMQKKKEDPYAVLLHQGKLPMSLLTDPKKKAKQSILQVESFADTFGAKAQRKKPRIEATSLEELVTQAAEKEESRSTSQVEEKLIPSDPIFQKGQSKRIWNELYKVIDSSDVLIHVLDARDPLGTRCRAIEEHIQKDAPHKHLVFLLNKTDLIPSSVAEQWLRHLAHDRPTLAFHASLTNPYGRSSLISLLRQFSRLHPDKRQISVGFVGYPNVGKSSIINALKQKAVCQVAPIPGQTKVWQYVTLMRRIHLIDCPGVVPAGAHQGTDTEKVLRGVVRVEHVAEPQEHILGLMRIVKPEHLSRTYNNILVPEISKEGTFTEADLEAADDFLSRLAVKSGRLGKGGVPDTRTVAIMVINDFLRGRIPYHTPLPYFKSVEEKLPDENSEIEGENNDLSDDTSNDSVEDEHTESIDLKVNLDELEQFYSDDQE